MRPARHSDLPVILDLIRELAAYDRAPGTVETTEDSLAALLFDAPAQLHAHVAEFDGAVVGLALWYFGFSTWTGKRTIHLEDFIVREAARSHGIGRALFQALARAAEARGCARIDWVVLDWNEAAMRFYSGIGVRPEAEWRPWRLDAAAIARLAGHGLPMDRTLKRVRQ
jgi:GNAT superfamily N-acetyltransferase